MNYFSVVSVQFIKTYCLILVDLSTGICNRFLRAIVSNATLNVPFQHTVHFHHLLNKMYSPEVLFD